MTEPTGIPQQRWANEVPNEGLIHYRTYLNEGRLIPTTPKALAEVLVQNSYEFVKPSQTRARIGRLLGIGLLLAEGEEHRIQRKKLMPAFSFRHVKDLYPVFWSKSRELVETIQTVVRAEAPQPTSNEEKAPAIEVGFVYLSATIPHSGNANCDIYLP